jgi:predicted NUDIX family NTP pyrophosphohydrolase
MERLARADRSLMLESAGLLVFRRTPGSVEFLLAHPGGPFWRRRDEGAWSIPKGLVGEGEAPLAAALREFQEEVGIAVDGAFIALTPRRQNRGKLVHCWMVEADLDLDRFSSNTFELEWPRASGRMVAFPEVDKVAYMAPPTAMRKLLSGQAPLIVEALERLGIDDDCLNRKRS